MWDWVLKNDRMLFSYWVMGRERTTDVALRQHPLISPTNFTFWWSVFNSFIIFIFIFYLICRYLTITFLKCQESIIITKHFLKNIQCYSRIVCLFKKEGKGGYGAYGCPPLPQRGSVSTESLSSFSSLSRAHHRLQSSRPHLAAA